MDYIPFEKDKQHIAREKEKAKQLRKTQWWRNQLAAGRCHYCQRQVDAAELTMDHVVPLARGGKSTKGNIVPCCKQCNSEKKYLTPVEILMKKLNDDKQDTTSD
ncbi:HNH endonuclease [candidate division KSB1 bacterium]|nr:HNH endonuclease [candidate division KSB1 bacterium]